MLFPATFVVQVARGVGKRRGASGKIRKAPNVLREKISGLQTSVAHFADPIDDRQAIVNRLSHRWPAGDDVFEQGAVLFDDTREGILVRL